MTTPIDSLGTTTTTSGSSGTGATPATAEATQDRFLTLLVNQLKNQDPLNPMDNAQVTTQLAQISTVSGIDKLNGTMKDMSANLLDAQSVQAASMIGRHVAAAGDKVEFDGTTAQMGFTLDALTSKTVVQIKDAKGNVVDEQQLDNLPAGKNSVEWNGETTDGGTAPPGVYTFTVTALDGVGGKTTVDKTFGYARVDSVSLDGGVTVNTAGLGPIAFKDIAEVI
ncbi:MAG: flagellar biosynthesis protein FlgD [Betaproteobacteria bacterium]|nr:flagellar biosynthesis protein FlgD [Betaproteobacteria bacterium]